MQNYPYLCGIKNNQHYYINMKKSIFVLFAVLLMAACQTNSGIVSVSDFNEKAPELVDQVINIKGIAVHVCQETHMKIFLSETEVAENTVLVMNNPDNEPFGNELIGKTVTVTGKVIAYVRDTVSSNDESEEEHCGAEATANTIYYIQCQSVKAE